MTGLPDGWSSARLGEVCEIVSGATPKTAIAGNWGGDVAWVTPDDLSKDRSQVISSGARSLTQAGYDSCSARVFPPGSVVFSSRAPIGYVAIAGAPLCTNQGCKTAVPPDYIDSKYLYHYLRWKTPDIAVRASGTTFKEISGRGFAETEFIWPDLEEQRRIVDILEDHLSRLDAAKTWLGSAGNRSAAMRRKSLGLLLEGDYPKRRLAETLELSIGGIWGDPPGESEMDVEVLRVTELREGGVIDPTTAAYRSCRESHYQSRSLREGDLLLEKSGGGPTSPVGRVGLVPALRGPSVCSNFMQLMRPDPSIVLPRYLHLYLNGFHLAGRTASMQTASTNIRNIKASEYLEIDVAVPDLQTQQRLVGEVEAVIDCCSVLEGEITRTGERLSSLRSAVLGAAFSGNLRTSNLSGLGESRHV